MFRGDRDPGRSWSSRDRALAVALTQLESALCSGCGQPQWLAFDPALSWEVDDDPLRCHPCTARDRAASDWLRPGEDGASRVEHPQALRWSVRQYLDN